MFYLKLAERFYYTPNQIDDMDLVTTLDMISFIGYEDTVANDKVVYIDSIMP